MSDTTYYAAVAQELAEGKLDQALWLKAKAAHPTNDREAQALYVRLKVGEMKGSTRSASAKNWGEIVGKVVLFLFGISAIGITVAFAIAGFISALR